jgi:hypothetical protein
MFGLQIKMVAGVAVLGGMFYGVTEMDKVINYVKTDGTVVSVKYDCYIESGRRKIVKKGTSDLAYMNCEIAPLVAAKYGYHKSDVIRRAHIVYEYVSPVDNAVHKGKVTKEYDLKNFKKGNKFRVYAHKEKPAKSKV